LFLATFPMMQVFNSLRVRWHFSDYGVVIAAPYLSDLCIELIKPKLTMEVITIESDAFKKLSEKIDNIERFVREAGKRTEDLDKMWVDGYTICQYLHVSERTLRRLRAQREITYSTVGRKYFYTIGSVKRSMEHKIIRSNEELLQKMIDHYGQNLDKAIKNNK